MSDGLQPSDKFLRRIEERRRAREAAVTEAAKPEFEADLIPTDDRNLSEADKALDSALNSIDIISAYNRYIGKMRPTVRTGQTESIMISCPFPWHRDNNPSAWINLSKQTFVCRACNDRGGDKFDMAAIGMGFNVDSYKTDGTFRTIKTRMAEDYGFVAVKLPGGGVYVATPAEEEPETPAPTLVAVPEPTTPALSVVPEPEQPNAEVVDLFEEAEIEYLVPELDWNLIIEPGTFLDDYMKATRVDDVPEEFHFFHGLLALGLALGRDVTLFDSLPVYGNLFLCTLGRSGSGKSKAKNHLDRLIEAALHHDWDDPNSRGTRRINSPGSAEVLIYNFQKPVADPSDPKKVAYNAPVRGLIEFNELSALLGRTNRMGSVIKPTLMSFYDNERVIATSSMTTGKKEAEQPFACAVTSTQPKALKTLLNSSDDASGFLNRWVFVLGTAKERFAIGGAVVDMTPAVTPLQEILGWASTFRLGEQVTWSEEAAMEFTNFFRTRIEIDKGKIQSDLIVRIDLLIKKLILLFTANMKLKEVPLKAVTQAIACYQFLLAGFAVPAEEIGNTLPHEVMTAIMQLVQKEYFVHKKGLTLRQIGKSLWRRKYPQDLLLRTADNLVKMGMLDLETQKAGDIGRPTVRYKYVD